MTPDAGKLVLRLTLALLILLHGLHKLVHGVSGIQGMLGAVGLPAWFAYGVYAGEVVGPLFLLAGYYARVGAALIAVNMLFAIGLAHRSELLALTGTGGWAIELQAMFLFSAIALLLIGPGRFSFDRR